jgi:CRISPR/Cas system CSM-associated protein Csm5 (group 7 of RAMP superfamily)
MTPKEKAKHLKEKFSVHEFNEIKGWFENEKESKQTAMMVCDEVLESFNSFMDARKNFRHELEIDAERYWLAVIAEIEKL